MDVSWSTISLHRLWRASLSLSRACWSLGGPADLSALWLLRCAAELAAAWSGQEDSAWAHQGHRALQDPEGRWQVRCSCLRPLQALSWYKTWCMSVKSSLYDFAVIQLQCPYTCQLYMRTLMCCRLCTLCFLDGWSATLPCWSPQIQRLPCGMKLIWSWLPSWVLGWSPRLQAC